MTDGKRRRGDVSKRRESQWDEARRLICELREIRDWRAMRLRNILGMNQNPGCGGDGSIDESRWYWLRDSILKLDIHQ